LLLDSADAIAWYIDGVQKHRVVTSLGHRRPGGRVTAGALQGYRAGSPDTTRSPPALVFCQPARPSAQFWTLLDHSALRAVVAGRAGVASPLCSGEAFI